MKRLNTIDADTLQSTVYEPTQFLISDLLPQGLHLLAGAPKIGKSWLALWLCLQVSPMLLFAPPILLALWAWYGLGMLWNAIKILLL